MGLSLREKYTLDTDSDPKKDKPFKMLENKANRLRTLGLSLIWASVAVALCVCGLATNYWYDTGRTHFGFSCDDDCPYWVDAPKGLSVAGVILSCIGWILAVNLVLVLVVVEDIKSTVFYWMFKTVGFTFILGGFLILLAVLVFAAGAKRDDDYDPSHIGYSIYLLGMAAILLIPTGSFIVATS